MFIYTCAPYSVFYKQQILIRQFNKHHINLDLEFQWSTNLNIALIQSSDIYVEAKKTNWLPGTLLSLFWFSHNQTIIMSTKCNSKNEELDFTSYRDTV